MPLVNVQMHGLLGEHLGRKLWKLAVKNVGEAMRAIEVMSNNKLFKFLLENDKKGVKYEVLINGKPFKTDKPLEPENVEEIRSSELLISSLQLKTIDVIPVLEGAGGKSGSIGAIILGVILIIVGIVLIVGSYGSLSAFGVPILLAGIGLVAGGVMLLLSKPPSFEDFREISGGGKTSYLFNGPQNVSREGGPVPVGYGRLLVGSQVVSASYELTNKNAASNPITV